MRGGLWIHGNKSGVEIVNFLSDFALLLWFSVQKLHASLAEEVLLEAKDGLVKHAILLHFVHWMADFDASWRNPECLRLLVIGGLVFLGSILGGGAGKPADIWRSSGVESAVSVLDRRPFNRTKGVGFCTLL